MADPLSSFNSIGLICFFALCQRGCTLLIRTYEFVSSNSPIDATAILGVLFPLHFAVALLWASSTGMTCGADPGKHLL